MKHRLATLRLAATAAILLAAPAVVRAQQTFYMSTDSGTIDTINPAGVVSTFATVSPESTGLKGFITGVAFSADGDLFTVNNKTGVISRITPAGAVSAFATLPAGSHGVGMAFDQSGNLYTANGGTDTIGKVSPAGVVTTFATLPAGSGPADLAFDADGNLFVASDDANDVSKITPDGTVSIFAKFGENSGSNALAFDASGNLFVSNYISGVIAKITSDGTKSHFAELGTKPEPFGMAFGPDGTLYVAVLSGIAVITPDGGVSTLATLGHVANFLRYGPAPAEPSTVATLVANVPQTTVGSGAPGEFTVTLSAPQAADVSIGYKVAGSAINGNDYASLGSTVNFFGSPLGTKIVRAGKTSAIIKVKLLEDLGSAAVKSVTLILAPGPGYTVDAAPTAKVKSWAAISRRNAGFAHRLTGSNAARYHLPPLNSAMSLLPTRASARGSLTAFAFAALGLAPTGRAAGPVSPGPLPDVFMLDASSDDPAAIRARREREAVWWRRAEGDASGPAGDSAFADRLPTTAIASPDLALSPAFDSAVTPGPARTAPTGTLPPPQAIETPSDGMAGDESGYAVGLSGTTGLTGSPDAAVNGTTGQGAAYVFRGLDTATGTVNESVKLVASDGEPGDAFGSAVSQSGTIGLVGAPYAPIGYNSSQGAAYVFRSLDTAIGTINESTKLFADDGESGDLFGAAVSLSGNLGLVGAPNASYPGTENSQGEAYVFRNLDTATGTQSESDILFARGGTAGAEFGSAVSLSGAIGLVGAYGTIINGNTTQGAVYVYRGLNTSVSAFQNATLNASDGAAYDYFGSAVSMAGTMGLVGAPGKTINGNNGQGAAYVFRGLDTASGTVTQSVKLLASDGATFDNFGLSVSLSGNTGLVAAPLATINGNAQAGAVYVFQGLNTATGTVTQGVKLFASNAAAYDAFGSAVSLDGDRFLIGAPYANNSTGQSYSSTISAVTTLDTGSASGNTGGISFVSQGDWIIGQTTSGNQVTLSAGDSANVTVSGKGVYVGQNAGSNTNTLLVLGTLTANSLRVGSATGTTTGNTLQLGNGGTTGSLSTGCTIIDNGNVTVDRSNAVVQGTDFSGAAIFGTGSLTKLGAGTLTLTAANTYTGPTNVNAGTLLFNGSSTGTGLVTVSGGSVLGGTGVVSAAVTVASGTINPGSNAGAAGSPANVGYLRTGALTLGGGGTLAFDLASGSQFDEVVATGNITLRGAELVLHLPAANPRFTAGQVLDLLHASGTLSGTLANFTNGSRYTYDGEIFQATYTSTDFTLTAINSVPEPATWLGGALLLGAASIGLRRRIRLA